ncbi:hypothetical protein [Francisella marina]|uniref:Uncharacterized protein n=1 Tax=Francisella marina TaxID=2249302 RepID=A0ABX5ZH44_9GAMM|nr:hypothetical protein [Francisella marina]QEO57598.1 hypothetical protein F0R74_06925 [Francisella marina]QEO58287.1 hypothetical protein F0R75_00315 [Francisella marina]
MKIKLNTNCHTDKYYIRIWLQDNGIYFANMCNGKNYSKLKNKNSYLSIASLHLYDKDINNLKSRIQSIINALEDCEYELKYVQDGESNGAK